MRKYDEYKDSEVNWIGRIPKHWELRKMKYTFEERSEKNHPEEPVLCATQTQGVIPQALYENRVVVVNKGYENLKFVRVGDFVISLRSFQGGIEYAHYQGIISSAYTILIPSEYIQKDYARFLFKSHDFIQLLKTCVTGIREGQNINYDVLRKKFIPIPPIGEQKSIAQFLDWKNSEIDNLISKTEREIELLKELKQSVVAHAVTKGLNPNVKMKDSGIGWIGEIPEHWCFLRNKNIFSGHYEEVGKRTDIPLLSLTTEGVVYRDTSTGKGKFPKDFEKYNVVYPDCIIFCLFDIDETPRTVGLCHNYGMITNAYDAFRINQNVLPRYITYYYLAVDNVKGLRPWYTGLRKVVQNNRFLQLKVPVPPLPEQQEIVEYIDYKTTQIDKMIVELTYKVEYLKQYKQRLIADVVTGKINVQPE